MGIRPTIKLSKNTWNSDETVESMVETVSGFFSGSKDIDDEMKARMRKYFEERSRTECTTRRQRASPASWSGRKTGCEVQRQKGTALKHAAALFHLPSQVFLN
jgi:hypothetical protein